MMYIRNDSSIFLHTPMHNLKKIHTSSCLQLKVIVISNFLFHKNKYQFFIKKLKKLGSLTYGTCIKNPYMTWFVMQLYASRNIHFRYKITFLDSLLEVLQEFSTLEKIPSLEIALKCIISEYNPDHVIRELRTRDQNNEFL